MREVVVVVELEYTGQFCKPAFPERVQLDEWV
jgi:hypothetical protein